MTAFDIPPPKKKLDPVQVQVKKNIFQKNCSMIIFIHIDVQATISAYKSSPT